MVPNDPQWSPMVPKCSKGYPLVPIGPQWSQKIPIDRQWSHRITVDPQWHRTIPIGFIWSPMVPKDHHWFPMVPKEPYWSPTFPRIPKSRQWHQKDLDDIFWQFVDKFFAFSGIFIFLEIFWKILGFFFRKFLKNSWQNFGSLPIELLTVAKKIQKLPPRWTPAKIKTQHNLLLLGDFLF